MKNDFLVSKKCVYNRQNKKDNFAIKHVTYTVEIE